METIKEETANTYQEVETVKTSYPEITKYITSLSKSQKETIIRKITEEDYIEDFENMEEMDNFIIDNLILGISYTKFKDNTEKGVINWCFEQILKAKTDAIIPGIKSYLYYPCFVSSLSATIKDIDLLDSIDRIIGDVTGYVSIDAITYICNTFNIAVRVRHIEKKTNMIEYGNKANKGWYGNPEKAKYCCEIARIEDHYIPWVEDTGITEYYLKNWKEIDKYAYAHKWSIEKRTHTYKQIKNNFIADENKKGLNSLRLIYKMLELGAFEPLKRNDEDVEMFEIFHNKRCKKIGKALAN